MRQGFPTAGPGQVVGLLGGSFDPAHSGHVHITREALRRFGLDRVWWLVSPGNPLKARGPAPMARRMERARQLMRHPRVTVTDIESQLGLRYTAQTIRRLTRLYPGLHFVWLMGADNLAQLHRWEDWRDIMEAVPVGVIARPGQRIAARTSPAARIFRAAKVPASEAHRLGRMKAPAWAFVNVPMQDASSSAIRAGGGWSSA
jgi:nicotinate-nucleotide adenylyltransferase